MQKHDYRIYCGHQENIPVWHQPWWLDALAKAAKVEWNVALSRSKGGDIVGSWPYFTKVRLGMEVSLMPVLSPYLGIWIYYPVQDWKNESLESYQNAIVRDLITQIPEFHLFKQNFSVEFTNWKELYWSGYRQTTHYTYILSDIKDHERIYAGLKSTLRNRINKNADQFYIGETTDVDVFYKINKRSWSNQKSKIPYKLKYLRILDEALKEHGHRYIRLIKDKQDRIVAGTYVVRDKHTAYNLMLGTDPEYRQSRAAEILLWDVIQEMSQYVDQFDFLGSMIPGVSQFFKAFGGNLVPYHVISNSKKKRYAIAAQLYKGSQF